MAIYLFKGQSKEGTKVYTSIKNVSSHANYKDIGPKKTVS